MVIKKMLPLLIWLSTQISISVFPDNALAAAIHRLGECEFAIEGIIQHGDADKFEGLLLDCSSSTLYLNSPGGVLSEALQIADSFNRTETVIKEGAECLSACALIFMAGRGCSGAPYFCTTYRRMSKSAKLGFHAPFLIQEEANPGALLPLNVSFNIALDIFSGIQEMFSRFSAEARRTGSKSDVIPLDLFSVMFSTPPEEFYYITNNDQFFSFEIPIFEDDHQEPIKIGRNHVYQLCYNLVYSEERGWNYSVFGFDDYNDANGFELESVQGWAERPKRETSNYDGDGAEYLMLFDGLNMGPSIYGLCHVQPQGEGYFEVRFFKRWDDTLDSKVNWEEVEDNSYRPEYGGFMHYSMAYPLQLPIGLIERDNLFDPILLDVVNSYFRSLDSEFNKTDADIASSYWIASKREIIYKSIETVCGANIASYDKFWRQFDYEIVRLTVAITDCGSKNKNTYAIDLYLQEEEEHWKIARIVAVDPR